MISTIVNVWHSHWGQILIAWAVIACMCGGAWYEMDPDNGDRAAPDTAGEWAVFSVFCALWPIALVVAAAVLAATIAAIPGRMSTRVANRIRARLRAPHEAAEKIRKSPLQ